MRPIVLVILGFLTVAAPGTAVGQTQIPPPVVQTRADPMDTLQFGPWLGAAAGTTVAIVAANAWTGGALLAPALGPAISGALGGTWLGMSALTPVGTRTFLETTSLVSIGIAGGIFGHWLVSQ